MPDRPLLLRRTCLTLALSALPVAASRAATGPLQDALSRFTGGQAWREGGVRLDIATLIENGNAVPVSITVDSPMSDADHVRAIGLFAERNPLPEVAVFTLTPRLPRASVSTRIRLATSQRVVALARMADGRCLGTEVEVIVTLAACIE